MNEDMETKHIYHVYREFICMIIASEQNKNPMLNFNKSLDKFDTPFVLDQYTNDQIDLISQLKKDINTLTDLLGYK